MIGHFGDDFYRPQATVDMYARYSCRYLATSLCWFIPWVYSGL